MAALRREVFEETGYSVDIGRFIGVYCKPEQDDIVMSFAATITGEVPRHSSPEIAEVRFFSTAELPTEMTEVARRRVEDGLAGSTGVFREFRGPDADERHYSWPG